MFKTRRKEVGGLVPKFKELTKKTIDPNILSGQTLAYLGDAVYEVYIRRHLVKSGLMRPQLLQRKATHYVSAKAQAGLITKLRTEKRLTKVELMAFRRGRNAKTHTKAKNTTLGTYKLSTGFESIIGYLDLAGQEERVKELVAWCIKTVEEGGLAAYDFQ